MALTMADDFRRQFHGYLVNRWTDSIIFSAVYVTAIFTGRHLMRDRKPFDLRPARVVWNGALTVFSIFGAFYTIMELLFSMRAENVLYTVCTISEDNPYYKLGVFWAAMFALSKLVELGDTVFIVLRKQPLIFLHWYHHSTVLIYTWFSFAHLTAAGRWFIVMNFIAHSFVYLYYTLAALRIRVPIGMKVLITCTQILQMVIGVSINVWTYLVKSRGGACQQTYENIIFSSIMYFTYFLLFSHFFHAAYIKRKEDRQKKSN